MKLFGTDGIRGKPGLYPLTSDLIERIVYNTSKITGAKEVLLGKDTRLSSQELEMHIIKGLKMAGCKVFNLGTTTTPSVSYLAKHKGALGIVITASHNPYYENGIKFFTKNGCKMSDELGKKIEESIQNQGEIIEYNGSLKDASYLLKDYKAFLKGVVSPFSRLKVVVDCSNGSGYEIFPEILRDLKINLIPIFNSPNGRNINEKCGSLYPEEACRVVLEEKANIGLCLDGDGDRLIAIDENGAIFNGDFMLGLFASYFKEKGILKNNVVVGTHMANMALSSYLKELDINFTLTDVGDKYVYNEMKKQGAILGGEPSGHIIFSEYLPTGDGILTSLKLMEVIKEKGSLSSLRKFEPYPSITMNIRIREKPDISQIPKFSEAIRKGGACLLPFGRILVRYSGTEPILRIMIEGKDITLIKEIGNRLSQIVKENIGE